MTFSLLIATLCLMGVALFLLQIEAMDGATLMILAAAACAVAAVIAS